MTAKVKAKKNSQRKANSDKKEVAGKPQIKIKKVAKAVPSKVEKSLSKTLEKQEKSEPAQRAGRTMTTRLSAKNQITIPVDVLRKAGFKVGDAINCTVDEDGKVLLSKPVNPMLQFAGIFSGMYEGFDLRADRDAWDE